MQKRQIPFLEDIFLGCIGEVPSYEHRIYGIFQGRGSIYLAHLRVRVQQYDYVRGKYRAVPERELQVPQAQQELVVGIRGSTYGFIVDLYIEYASVGFLQYLFKNDRKVPVH